MLLMNNDEVYLGGWKKNYLESFFRGKEVEG